MPAGYPHVSSRVLKRFFEAADLRILDVGARGGPYRELGILAPFAHILLCEPDRKEAKELKRTFETDHGWKKVTMIGFALSTKPGNAALRITRFPGLSSLFDPDMDVVRRYYPSEIKTQKENLGYWEVEKTETVRMMTLDDVVRNHAEGRIDIIKLDTQGTELDILSSGRSLALPSAVAVYIETEFLPLYKGQPLFGEVHGFLVNEGFRLIDLKRTMMRRADVKNAPVFSKRELGWAHCLYIRERHRDGSVLNPEEIQRLSSILVAFWFFDYAIRLLETPQMERFMKERGWDGVPSEIAAYAAEVWQRNKRHMSRDQIKKCLTRGYQDKLNEF